MTSKVWLQLRNQINKPEYLWAVWVFGTLAAVLVPLLLVMGGWLIDLLLVGQSGIASGNLHALPERSTIGYFFELPTSWLNASGSTLRGVLAMIVLMMIVMVMEAIALLTSYRAALHTSLDLASDIQRNLFSKSGALAVEHGLSGQQVAMQDMFFIHVPQVREATHQWYRAFPRHFVQTVLLILLALSIQAWISILAIICAAIVWMLFNNLEIARRKKRPVQFERARTATEQLSYLCESAPLLASMHDIEETQSSFESQLNAYRKAHTELSDGGIIRSPTMLLTCTALIAFLMMVIAIRFLDQVNNIHFGELATLFGAVVLSITGTHRLVRAYRKYQAAERGAQVISSYLEQSTNEQKDRKWTPLTAVRHEIVLDHVTIRDSSSQKLLEDISATIKPGQLTAIIASQNVQASALAELILGFGRPASGRILIDGIDSTDIEPSLIRDFSLWVAPSGPLVNGTLTENLLAGTPPDATMDLLGLAKRMHVAEPILNLPDGLSTIVTTSEDRLQPDQLFRLGLTRALIKLPRLIVAREPSLGVKPATESETLDAILQLKSADAMLVVLSQRLSTLRAADQIIVLHEHRIAAIGTHSQLLEQSEIYRHLNYMQFSPFGDLLNR